MTWRCKDCRHNNGDWMLNCEKCGSMNGEPVVEG